MVPSPNEIKASCFLPESANFHGWLIHNPEKDDFLAKYLEKGDSVSKLWCAFPDGALRFNRHVRAFKVVQKLDIQNQTIIVAAFDLGSQIIIIAPDEYQERMSLPSNNPFRSPKIKTL
ncbi:hypothetical protein O4H50_20275 [Vibrio diazotrophicus]|uniref:hypothetical protein n=1 Tax=Vibrio diazotrophicus TaxID=685 RepID=UPI0022AFEDE0|nr:hypothetical protein [Vibrio diazotrophicus]MCZ4374131.1 hypothetical protein [Vibrio diazotrophicus]MCZ4374136.1 hypothetical protein [Vibrio diazotrophicus]